MGHTCPTNTSRNGSREPNSLIGRSSGSSSSSLSFYCNRVSVTTPDLSPSHSCFAMSSTTTRPEFRYITPHVALENQGILGNQGGGGRRRGGRSHNISLGVKGKASEERENDGEESMLRCALFPLPPFLCFCFLSLVILHEMCVLLMIVDGSRREVKSFVCGIGQSATLIGGYGGAL
ncbi:uncharacterized protein HKW66_Vig0230530 [Vigna angularis]|uniref:Uncharacterized protein n=1 Tax=Phaseolus angularis TaxID=3914 RepID=A0A8T0KBI5_PHAAN|nr:uncharacterized protein HKW66_Vig0230530 [Vigna angularis]